MSSQYQVKLEQMALQHRELKNHIFELVCQILDELELRLMDFAEQVAEQVFKAFPEVSTQFDPPKVKQFKKDVQNRARDSVRQIIGTLADEDYWLNESGSKRSRDSLRHNTKVWPVVQSFGESLAPVLSRHGYPCQTGVMDAPFKEAEIKHMEQLPHSERLRLWVVKYWLAFGKYKQLANEMLKVEQAQNQMQLTKMWNAD